MTEVPNVYAVVGVNINPSTAPTTAFLTLDCRRAQTLSAVIGCEIFRCTKIVVLPAAVYGDTAAVNGERGESLARRPCSDSGHDL